MRKQWTTFGTLAVLVSLIVAPGASQVRDTLPLSLSDREFWALTESISEPDAFFRSNSGSPDNLLSNELNVSFAAAGLADYAAGKPGGVYLGVGPEQNFTYIAAMKPRMAFITDIRRGNLHVHLIYKAVFELSANRADFVARLFNRKRPAGLGATSGAGDILNAFLSAEPAGEDAYKANLKAITDHLTKTRALPLGADDLAGLDYVYGNYNRFGPAINYTSSVNGRTGLGSYAVIVSASDAAGRERTFLANEENFAIVKALQAKNLIVPVVGNFSGQKALRGIGAYLKERRATVGAFYVSNVESYLKTNGVWDAFCANVASMPLDAASVFIRPSGRSNSSLFPMQAETAACAGK